jgi:hypothetical protein
VQASRKETSRSSARNRRPEHFKESLPVAPSYGEKIMRRVPASSDLIRRAGPGVMSGLGLFRLARYLFIQFDFFPLIPLFYRIFPGKGITPR